MKRIFLKTPILALITVVLLLSFHIIGILGPVESLIGRGLHLPQKFIYSFGLNLKNIFTNYDSNQENERLKVELQGCVVDATSLKLLENENKLLREELEFLEKQNYSYVVARIIAREPELNQKIVIINQGFEAGVRLGYPVTVAERIAGAENSNGLLSQLRAFLVGKIVKVNRYDAWVLLLTDNRSSVAAELLNKKEVYGLVRGERGLSLGIDLIPLGSDIKVDDIVVTSGLENMIPEGLIIGRVGEIESKPGEFFQRAKVKPLISFDNLKIVSVILSDGASL